MQPRPPLSAIPGHLIRALPLRTVLLFGLAIGAAIAFVEIADEVVEGNADRVDIPLADAIARLRNPAATAVFRVVTFAGSWPTVVTAIGATVLWAFQRRDWRAAAVLIVSAMTVAIMNALLKLLFARERPSLPAEIPLPASYSFPSGHAMIAAAAYGVIGAVIVRLRPSWRAPVIVAACMLVLAIGFSRVYLGVHWPLDVLAGFAAGAVPLAIAVHALRAPRA